MQGVGWVAQVFWARGSVTAGVAGGGGRGGQGADSRKRL